MKCTENYVKLNFLSRSSNESSAKVAADFAAQLDPTLDELEDMICFISSKNCLCLNL